MKSDERVAESATRSTNIKRARSRRRAARRSRPPCSPRCSTAMNGPAPQAAPPPAAAAVIDPEPAMMAEAVAEPPAAVAAPKPDQDARRDIRTRPTVSDSLTTRNTERRIRCASEGGFRRSLIRATFPRPDGQAPPPRAIPEFTIQSLNNRRNNNGQRNAGGAEQVPRRTPASRRPAAAARTTSGRCASAITVTAGTRRPGQGRARDRAADAAGAAARRIADGGLHGKSWT